MSIDLPHNQRALHFTGSVKALAPERPANALGQERPKGPLPSPGRSIGVPLAPPPRSVRANDVYLSEARPTPYVGSRPSERAEAAKKLTTMRGQLASMDDDLLTDALDRNEIDAALFPIAKRENAGAPAPNLPVPGFRSAAEVQKQRTDAPAIIVPRAKGGSLPLGVWIAMALIAGVVSFNFAPQAAESFSEAVRALEARR